MVGAEQFERIDIANLLATRAGSRIPLDGGCLLDGRIVVGTGMRLVSHWVPVGFSRSVFAVRGFILSARAGAPAIFVFVLFCFGIPFVSLNRWHMGTQGGAVRSPCLGDFVSAFSTGRDVAPTASRSLPVAIAVGGRVTLAVAAPPNVLTIGSAVLLAPALRRVGLI